VQLVASPEIRTVRSKIKTETAAAPPAKAAASARATSQAIGRAHNNK
jgi:hypothetical protein